jgi:glyoxylase-like metal-dependent hydrolase (beta-lactamase superfamily II)
MLDLIDLDQSREGYRKFISCWLYRDDRVSFVVDPGPRSSIDALISSLRERGVDHLDYVLLTHIHLDHGGGCADLLGAFEQARLYCHPKGLAHLKEPERLWQGSVKTLGAVAEMYGEPQPVAADRFVDEQELAERGIRILPTPGHAPHHVSFLVGETLFAGEAIATIMAVGAGQHYFRPATPPRFVPDVFLASLSALAVLDPEPAICALAHHGQLTGLRFWCAQAREQLLMWIDAARQYLASGSTDVKGLFDVLLEVDPRFGQGRFQALPPDIQVRERYYVGNSLRGILQHLQG